MSQDELDSLIPLFVIVATASYGILYLFIHIMTS